ncbi:hypothetical protein WP50_37940 [Lactiplantibacillus plantarum]|nr:hypothetical protein WP50_37940 [Lactiplantibacillus plantarum]
MRQLEDEDPQLHVTWSDQKVNQLRVYNGTKYATTSALPARSVSAITGLTGTRPGQGLGQAATSLQPVMQPVLTYALDPQREELHTCLAGVGQLEHENSQ